MDFNSLDNVKEDYYAVLGCAPHHSNEMIKGEYKRLALELHPDRHKGDPERTKRFKQLNEAFEVLINEKERTLYDKWRLSGLQIRFKQWRASFASSPPVTHWAEDKDFALSIEGETPAKQEDPAESLKHQFRNYDI